MSTMLYFSNSVNEAIIALVTTTAFFSMSEPPSAGRVLKYLQLLTKTINERKY